MFQAMRGFAPGAADIEKWIRKGLDSTAATTGDKLIPQKIDPYITELNMRLSPLRTLIPRIPWTSGTYDKRLRSARGRGRFVGDGKSAPIGRSTYLSFAEPIKRLQVRGQVTHFLGLAAQEFTDPLRNEIKGCTVSANWLEEWALLYANKYADETMWSGMEQWSQTGYGKIYDGNGATISTDILDTVIDNLQSEGVFLGPDNAFFLTTPKMISKISSLKQSGQRWNDQVEVSGGFRFRDYRGIPLVPTSFIAPNQAWPGGTVTATPATSGGAMADGAYYYYVSAILETGETLPCTEVTATISGGSGAGSIELSWTAPATAGAVYLYKIYRTAAGGASGSEVHYTTIPGTLVSEDSVGFGFLSATDVITWVDTGSRTTQTTTFATGTVSGAAYTPAYAPANLDELAANEEDMWLFCTKAPVAEDGNLLFLPTLKPMGYQPLPPLGEYDWFYISEYAALIAIEQYQTRIARVKAV
ncbi:MAG: hypothetical protein ACE15D_18750 [Candidatus Eisenbacteria bacterium]